MPARRVARRPAPFPLRARRGRPRLGKPTRHRPRAQRDPSPSAAPALKAGTGKLLALTKWSLGAAIGVGLIGAGVALLRPSAPPSAAAPSSAPQAALTPPAAGEPPAAAALPAAPSPAPSGPMTRAPLPLQASAPPAPAPAAASPPRPKSAAPRAGSARGAPGDALGEQIAIDALGEQVAMIDRARDALAAGDAAGCLTALDAHDSKFPRSAMGEEATVLRIEALIRRGDRSRAAELGQRFLASRPTSAHASGVRALLGAAKEP
ncbi:hypothetical protein [Sorangium atrum]|uniref:Uncharacterized protein n=1 Tax=Sorangium atrum TaxID=2995308 RepID=A0ABT5BTX7_9BACT|nr:hypothetical protein [Sorangium aterium]MDC0677615.1 hypothetical protein [Sorangium aterium]